MRISKKVAIIAVLFGSSIGALAKSGSGLTTAEAQTVHYRFSIAGSDFDVPATYFFRNFKTIGDGKVWPRPRSHERQQVDVFTIHALLPAMEPYTEERASIF